MRARIGDGGGWRVSDGPIGRQPTVAATFVIGLGILLVSLAGYRLVVPLYRPISTVVFLLGLFGFGITIVSGGWYVLLLVRELL